MTSSTPFSSSLSVPLLLLLLFLLLLLPHLSLPLPPSTVPPPTTVPAGGPDLIRKTCNSTTYFDLCVLSLRSDPISAKADVRGLSTILINLGISNATSTSSYASRLLKRSRDPALRLALGGCAGRYADARDALWSTVDALSLENYDFASVDVGAATGYADTCRSLFRLSPGLAYPAEMARREEALERLCTIALDMITLLG